jgi:hypothetical protein
MKEGRERTGNEVSKEEKGKRKEWLSCVNA